ncbi:MAG: lytic transglycosylase domain-containing protein, partial [Arenimonas sp.]
MNALPRSLLCVCLAALAACQPVVRPTTPETAVVGVETPVAAPAADAAQAEALMAGTASPALAASDQTSASDLANSPDLMPAQPIQAVVTGADVFARINRGLSPNSCEAGSNSERWRQRYAGSPAAFARRVESVLPLIDFVSTEVERAGLPAEFAFIPLVESWYQPGAIGSGGPAGMWQMISSTARNHGIHIQSGYDGRLSPVESTRAALSYLKTLQGIFDNWQSIVMAYNAGEGRVARAFARADNRTASAV